MYPCLQVPPEDLGIKKVNVIGESSQVLAGVKKNNASEEEIGVAVYKTKAGLLEVVMMCEKA